MNTLKQVWHMIMTDKLFSGIYIFGTALALATGTVLAASFWSRIEPAYPEVNRARTCYIQSGLVKNKEGSTGVSSMSYTFVRDFAYNLKNVEAVSGVVDVWGDSYAPSADGGADVVVDVKGVDPGFFKVFDFDFLAGAPFGQTEFESGLPLAIITEETARKTLGAGDLADMLGRTIAIDYKDHRVTGIVHGAPSTMTASHSDIYVPYTTIENYDVEWRPMLGDMEVIIVTDDREDVRRQLDSFVASFNASNPEGLEFYMYEQPIGHFQHAFAHAQMTGYSPWDMILETAGSLLLLLIVPALNLSGIISGRMESRLCEMGVRKSFGATRGQLLRQVLTENLVLTIAGGLIGLACAWAFLSSYTFSTGNIFSEATLGGHTVFSPAVFATLLVLCALLNVMSALVPSWRSLRRPIVESLKEN